MKNIVFAILLTSISLFAQPDIAQVKQAIKANPALLDTPQAKKIMQEKGITKQQALKEINKTDTKTSSKQKQNNQTSNETSNNKDNKTNTQKNSNETKNDIKELVKKGVNLDQLKINPFSLENDKIIKKLLSAKQIYKTQRKLSRYALNFHKNKNAIDSASLPTPNNYIVSNGDMISIHVYGDRDESYILKVGNDGAIEMPFIGPISVGGMKFKDLKAYLNKELKTYFKNSSFKIDIDKYSTIQVILVGDVKSPGIYNLSSFSTIKDLFLSSSGVRDTASVRDIIIKRDGKIIARVDYYDLLFKGKNLFSTILKHGDIIQVHKAKKLVGIDGDVNYAAVFELKNGENLDKLLSYAGGFRPNASKAHIKITRFQDNALIKTFDISYDRAKHFKLKHGDRVYVYPLSFSANQSIKIYGNIIRPGSYEIGKNASLHNFFKKVLQDGSKSFFLPETYFEYAIIKTYNKQLNFTTKSFNLKDVIKGKKDIKLNPRDELYIFNQNDIFSDKYVTTMDRDGVLIHPGKLKYIKGMTINDAINASGIKSALDKLVRVTTYNTKNFMPKTFFYSLDKDKNVTLSAYDEIEVYGYYSKNTIKPVSISGEVNHQTQAHYEEGMTLQDLVDYAGGLKETAYKQKVEIVRYYLDEQETRKREVLRIPIINGYFSDVRLQPYDEVKIFKIPKWNERKTITLKGEVRFPGTYVIENGDTLYDILKRAGGFTNQAFIEGAIFTRESVRQRQIKNYQNSLLRIKKSLALYNAMPANASDSSVVSKDSLMALNEVMEEAKKYNPIGRLSMHLDENLTGFKDSNYNIILKDKDTLTVPSRIDTVTVFGEVYNPTTFIYDKKLSLDDYIAMASGYTRSADDGKVYVIHADGTSEPVKTGWFNSKKIEIKRGDTIVVPLYIKENNRLKIADTVAKIFASFALTVASLNALGVF